MLYIKKERRVKCHWATSPMIWKEVFNHASDETVQMQCQVASFGSILTQQLGNHTVNA